MKAFWLDHILRAKAKPWVQEQRMLKSTVSAEERLLKSVGHAGAQPCFARAHNHQQDCHGHSRQSAHPHVCLAGPAAGVIPRLSTRRGCTPTAAICSQLHLDPSRHRQHLECMPADHSLQPEDLLQGTLIQGAALCSQKTRGRQSSTLGQGHMGSIHRALACRASHSAAPRALPKSFCKSRGS